MRKSRFMPLERVPSPPFPLDAGDRWIISLLLGIFGVSRLAWLYWNPSSVPFFEESYRWMVAHELLTNPVQPLLEYQADHYQGGSLVMSLLTLPFFKLFGESMVSLKLSALTVSLGILSTLYILGRRFFGRDVGTLAATAYLVGPPLVAYHGLVVMGSHSESILFSLLQMLLFLGILEGSWRRPWGWTAFGLVSGLGLWFCYTTGLSLAACALCWIVLEKLPRPKELLWATAGGLAGLSPWFVYNFQYDFKGIERLLQMFGYGNPVDPWPPQRAFEKFIGLLSHDLPVGLLTPMEGTLSYSVLVPVAVAFGIPIMCALICSMIRVAAVFRQRSLQDASPDRRAELAARRSELAFIFYGVVFLTVFLGSRYTVEPMQWPTTYRFFTPPAVLLMIPAAITTARAVRRGRLIRCFAVAGCCVSLLAATVATIALAVRPPSWEHGLSLEGGYVLMGMLLHHKYESDLHRSLAIVSRIPDPAIRERLWLGIGWRMEYRFEKEGTIQHLREQLESIPLSIRQHIILGMIWIADTRLHQISSWVREHASGDRYTLVVKRLKLLLEFARIEGYRIAIVLNYRWHLDFSAGAYMLPQGQEMRINIWHDTILVDGQPFPLEIPPESRLTMLRLGVYVPRDTALRISTADRQETIRPAKDLFSVEAQITKLPMEIALANEGGRGILLAGWLELVNAQDKSQQSLPQGGIFDRSREEVLPGSGFFVADGWHGLEEGHRRWTKGRGFALFRNPLKPMVLKLEGLLPSLPNGALPQTVHVRVNGHVLGELNDLGTFSQTYFIPEAILGSSEWGDLELRVNQTLNPKALGLTEDFRDLGVLVNRLELLDLELPSDGYIDLGTRGARP
jgi:4-amino-4-deoxy-L-arabinose transferase-like glycosyltransferase